MSMNKNICEDCLFKKKAKKTYSGETRLVYICSRCNIELRTVCVCPENYDWDEFSKRLEKCKEYDDWFYSQESVGR